MAENLDTAGFSAIFISVIEMGHENTKNLKSIYKTEDFRNLNPSVSCHKLLTEIHQPLVKPNKIFMSSS